MSRRYMVLAMVVLAATACLGLWFIANVEAGLMKAWSWVGVAALAVGTVAAAIQIKRPVRVILTPQGFTVTGLFSPGLIPWTEVETFLVYREEAVVDIDGESHGGAPAHAAWRLKPGSTRNTDMVSRLNRGGGLPIDGSLPRHMGLSPEALAELMEDWRVRYE